MKRGALLIALAIMVLCLASVAAQDAPVEITMWDIPHSDAYVEWWRNYVDEFNAAHPEIHVNLEFFESEPYKARVQAALAAGTEPDIFYTIPGTQTATYFREGKLIPVGELLDGSLFTQASVETCSVDGTWVCMPLFMGPTLVYYNRQQFEDAGINPETDWANPVQPTWEEFLTAADALKEAGYVPIALGNAENWPGLFFYWALQNRFGGVDEFYETVEGEGSYCAPSFIRAGEMVQDLAGRDYFPMGYQGIGGGQKYALFTQGNGAMIFQGPWMVSNIAEEAPEDFEYGTFHFPSLPEDGDPDSQTDIMTGIDALFVSAQTDNPEAVAELLNGFASPENAIDFMADTSNVSVIRSVQDAGDDSGVNPDLLALMEMASFSENTYPWWDWALPPEVAEEMLSMSQGLFAGEITPEEFCGRLDEVAGKS